MNINIEREAQHIIIEHTKAFMSSGMFEPKDDKELYDAMVRECSYILVKNLCSHKYTLMEYNAIRNEIGKILHLCSKH